MRFQIFRRRVIALLLAMALVPLSGCIRLSDLSEMERLFPDSALRGAVTRASVRDVIESSVGKSLGITANAVIPDTPKTEQLKPTGLTILRRLKEKYPDAKSIDVAIYDDERALSLGLTVAKAGYREGSVTITGGVPTETEVAAVNAKRGKGEKRGPFGQPREEDFNIAHKVLELTHAVPPADGLPETAIRDGASNEETERKAAAFFNIPVDRVRTARYNLATWYGMHRDEKLFEKN